MIEFSRGDVSIGVGPVEGRKSSRVTVTRGSVMWTSAYLRNEDEERRLVEALTQLFGEVRNSEKVVVEFGDLSLADAVRTLPTDFVSVYESLFLASLRTDRGGSSDAGEVGVAGARRVTRVSTNQVETRGGSKGSRKSGGSADLVRSQRMLEFKGRVDRRLRKIARDIKAEMRDAQGDSELLRRCTVCRTFGESGWLYCPKDGKPMESLDR